MKDNKDNEEDANAASNELRQATTAYWEQVDRLRLLSLQYQNFGLRLQTGLALQMADLEGLAELQELRDAIAQRDHWEKTLRDLYPPSQRDDPPIVPSREA